MVGDTSPDNRPATILESALRYDRAPVVVLLIVVPLVSWLWIVAMARDMYGPMTGASAWMMTAVWDPWHLVLLWAMWAVMMAAMMLPSASPMLLLYGTVARRSALARAGARQLTRSRPATWWCGRRSAWAPPRFSACSRRCWSSRR